MDPHPFDSDGAGTCTTCRHRVVHPLHAGHRRTRRVVLTVTTNLIDDEMFETAMALRFADDDTVALEHVTVLP